MLTDEYLRNCPTFVEVPKCEHGTFNTTTCRCDCEGDYIGDFCDRSKCIFMTSLSLVIEVMYFYDFTFISNGSKCIFMTSLSLVIEVMYFYDFTFISNRSKCIFMTSLSLVIEVMYFYDFTFNSNNYITDVFVIMYPRLCHPKHASNGPIPSFFSNLFYIVN